MKPIAPEPFRVTLERAVRMKYPVALATVESDGRNGMFIVPYGREFLRCIVSDGEHSEAEQLKYELRDWEHVSVSLPSRCPTWGEMCAVKDVFFAPDETVIQFHPPRSEYVNNHPFCLHLWRCKSAESKTPPAILVGLI